MLAKNYKDRCRRENICENLQSVTILNTNVFSCKSFFTFTALQKLIQSLHEISSAQS